MTSPESRPDLLSLTPAELRGALRNHFAARGQPAYRVEQAETWIFRSLARSPREMTDLPASEREALADGFDMSEPEQVRQARSEDGTVKHLWRLEGGALVESVLIPSGSRLTLCLSSQAGCAMGCTFCATGWGGFERQLTAGEIVGQFRASSRWAAEAGLGPIGNVVYMGMGEPLANRKALDPSLTLLNHGYGVGARRITVSTVGVVPGIRELAARPEQFRLALSLHAPTSELRAELIPLERRHPLPEVLAALRDFQDAGGKRVTFEYTMIRDVNDALPLAPLLADLARDVRAFVNLIPFNPIPDRDWVPSPLARVRAFERELSGRGVAVAVREPRGRDIDAACGQLRAREAAPVGRGRAPLVLLAASLLSLGGCGMWPGSGADESAGGPQVATEQPAVQEAGPASDTTVAAAPDTSAPGTVVPSLDIAARLDRIVAGQEELAARLDSLASTTPVEPQSSASRAPEQVLGEAGQRARSFGVGVVWSVIVIVLFTYFIRAVAWVLETLAERSATRRLFYKKLAPIARIVLWVFAAYIIVRVIFRVDAQGLFAAAAAVGVAVGFAAQDLLKNLFGGLILVFDQPFQVGDKIRAGSTYGEVVAIGLRSTRIVTPDDNLVTVPNAQVVDGQVANANAGELNCQVVTDLFLPGWIDESRAKRIAFEAAASSKYVFLNKPIVVLVTDEFRETFLTRIRVKAYVLDPRYEFLFQSDVTERARAGFRAADLLKPEHGMRAYLDLTRTSQP